MLGLYRKAYSSDAVRTERAVFISTMKTIKFLSPAAAEQLLSNWGWAQLAWAAVRAGR